MALFPVMFQWFVLLATTVLAGVVIKRIVDSVRHPGANGVSGANGADGRSSGASGGAGGFEGGAGGSDVAARGGAVFFSAGSKVFWQILILAAVSRILLYCVGYLSAVLFIDGGAGEGFWNSLPGLWQRSDAPHYISIVENGYVNTGEDRVFLVFLPFYPLLTKLFALVVQDAVIAGLLVSHLSFLAVCVLVYEVALLAGQDGDTAFMASAFAIFFPASFFVNGTFSESLFLLASALFFHLLLRKKWLPAAVFGLFAAVTRYYGVLLAIPYAVEFAQRFAASRAAGTPPPSKTRVHAASRSALSVPRVDRPASPWIAEAAPILLIPAGTGLFLVVNYIVSGNFLQFLTYQREHWNQRFAFFFGNMGTLASNALNFDAPTRASLFIPELVCIVLFLTLLTYGVLAKFRLSMLAYLGVYFILTISASWLLSFERYIFGALPVFSLLASAGRKSRFAGALLVFVCLTGLFFLTVAYVCGKHVY